ncbi:MAG: hypothetical protein IJS73_03955 [Paludibacteraceae bacterium]|nr:hypothetical protein [Paludibacteraceae bacterium]
MKKQIVAHIECNKSGFFTIYTNENLPFGLFGEGQSAESAKKDFLSVFNEMCKLHEERTNEKFNADVHFVYDTSALLQEYKNIISFVALSKVTGINKAQLSQYACGSRHPKEEQRRKIIEGIHTIGRECMSVTL